MRAGTRVLVSGCGVAGATLAFWLHRAGASPMVVEQAGRPDGEGYMIDFYGSGFDVAEKMGLIDALRARHYPVPELQFVDRAGKRVAALDVQKFRALLEGRHFNFMRGDLAGVLHDAICDDVPVRFHTEVAALRPGADGVEVDLSDGTTERFDIVVGADGIHSHVRELVWGPEGPFDRFLGYYVACAVVEDFLGDTSDFLSTNQPGRQAAVYPIRGGLLATFLIFRSPPRGALSPAERMDLLDREFADMGWVVPQVLEAMRALPEFFFDPVTQIQLPNWHRGRVTLVGDACQCLTLLAGQGASMAMAGAYVLAQEMGRSDDPGVAFAAYQARMEPEIEKRQAQARGLAGSFVPSSRFGLWIRNQYLKVAFWPILRRLFIRQIGAKSIV